MRWLVLLFVAGCGDSDSIGFSGNGGSISSGGHGGLSSEAGAANGGSSSGNNSSGGDGFSGGGHTGVAGAAGAITSTAGAGGQGGSAGDGGSSSGAAGQAGASAKPGPLRQPCAGGEVCQCWDSDGDCGRSACVDCLHTRPNAQQQTCFDEWGPCALGTEMCQPNYGYCTFLCDRWRDGKLVRDDAREAKCKELGGHCEGGTFTSHCVF